MLTIALIVVCPVSVSMLACSLVFFFIIIFFFFDCLDCTQKCSQEVVLAVRG